MATKRLVILTEGDSELQLMNRLVIPQLYNHITNKGIKTSWSIESFKITTNKNLNKKGGNINYEYLKNEIKRLTPQGVDVITTFLDFFQLPTSFPGYTTDGNAINTVEAKMNEDMRFSIPNLQTFIPYIQKYEFEALLFSDMEGFEFIIDNPDQLSQLQSIYSSINVFWVGIFIIDGL